ncbi:Increased recombination centers protein 22 [Scheffersomyces spartinae]|uniref:Increased recombination centers protein 22 n=1 Tax=Scheffersomyces spartinae TaxID=45513 RepID=A0A9P7V911_9ASCO|nr:Increased recombination centers protein 22 [Scheffersomyces spartinae]KAG7193597.1 Increased recombination centers protein 22 [Scheffersomyces spartinae]
MKVLSLFAGLATVAGIALGVEFTQEYGGEGPYKPSPALVEGSAQSGDVIDFKGYDNGTEAIKQFMPEMKDKRAQFVGFTAFYHIDGYETLNPREFAEFKNGQVVDIVYELVNKEEESVIIVAGTGGVIRDVNDLTVKANISITPLERKIRLDPGDKHKLIQKVEIHLEPQAYIFTPQLYIMVNEQPRMVQARAQMINVEDEELSVIDPQFLLLELLLVVSVLGLAYLGYELWGKSYIQSRLRGFRTLTQTSKIKNKLLKKQSQVKSKDWIPDSHLRNRKKN